MTFLFTKKKKYLDSTSGLTGTAILGWKNLDIENAIKDQLSKICLTITNILMTKIEKNLLGYLLQKQIII